jgi:hypothetical protein
MPHIVLTADQARILEVTTLEVEVRDEEGRVLARIPPPSEAEIIERIKRNQLNGDPDSPRYSSAEVQARLHRLEEISREEGLDEAKVRDLLRRMRAGEEV